MIMVEVIVEPYMHMTIILCGLKEDALTGYGSKISKLIGRICMINFSPTRQKAEKWGKSIIQSILQRPGFTPPKWLSWLCIFKVIARRLLNIDELLIIYWNPYFLCSNNGNSPKGASLLVLGIVAFWQEVGLWTYMMYDLDCGTSVLII